MKTVIAGSRNITDYAQLLRAIATCPVEITEVISSGARGADSLGEHYARQHGLPIHLFPADWDRYGRSAGHRRNADMAAAAEAVLCMWDGASRGTAGMIQQAQRRGLPLWVFRTDLDQAMPCTPE